MGTQGHINCISVCQSTPVNCTDTLQSTLTSDCACNSWTLTHALAIFLSFEQWKTYCNFVPWPQRGHLFSDQQPAWLFIVWKWRKCCQFEKTNRLFLMQRARNRKQVPPKEKSKSWPTWISISCNEMGETGQCCPLSANSWPLDHGIYNSDFISFSMDQIIGPWFQTLSEGCRNLFSFLFSKCCDWKVDFTF